MAQQSKNPVIAYRTMAIANLVAALLFAGFYIPYNNAGGSHGYFLLIIAGVMAIAGVASFVLYGVFQKKLAGGGK